MDLTQQAVNGALGILVESSIKKDIEGALIGAKILRSASESQIATARDFCRIKHHYTLAEIERAMTGEP